MNGAQIYPLLLFGGKYENLINPDHILHFCMLNKDDVKLLLCITLQTELSITYHPHTADIIF